jgi:hypothetical protein
VETGARARLRKHLRAQARGDHQHYGPASGRNLPGSGITGWSREHRHRRWRDRASARRSPRRR